MAGSPDTPIDLVIIGGGLSGLVSAYKIEEKIKTLSVLLIEAAPELGGQLKSTNLGEIGGRWITEDQNHIYNLIGNLSVGFSKRENFQPNLQRYWSTDNGLLAQLKQFEINRFIVEIDKTCLKCRQGCFNLMTNNIRLDKFLNNRLFFNSSRRFFKMLIRLVCGIDPIYLTKLEFLNLCCSNGGLSQLITLSTGSSNSLIEFSSKELIQNLVQHLENTVIMANTKITEIVNYSEYVLAKTGNGDEFYTSCLILAIPWNQVTQLKMFPRLPAEFSHPLQENNCQITSFLAKYSESYWRAKGYSGSLLLDNLNMIGYEYKPMIYGGIILHDDNGFELISKAIILDELANIFGDEMAIPEAYEQKTFEQNLLINLSLSSPWNRLVWSSTCSATHYRGFLGGAVQSGLRAAVRALYILRPQTVNWQDLNEIQKASVVRPRYNWLDMKLSQWNLYDIIRYTVAGLSLFCLFKLRFMIKNIFKYNSRN